MKKMVCLMLLFATALVSLTSCSKEENRLKKTIIGTWDATEIKINGDWSSIPSSRYSMSMTFYDDGRYYGKSDYFGTGYGTYDIMGKTIITYADGRYMYTYRVNSYTETIAEVTMTDEDSSSGASLDIRLRKR